MSGLTRVDLESMLRDPTKDKRYLETQLGAAVADYLSWKENERGARPRTLDQYERDLARMCLAIDKPPALVTTDDLRLARDLFPKGSRGRAGAAMRDFWRFLFDEERITLDPMARIRAPRRQGKRVLPIFTEAEEARLISAQQTIRDRTGVLLLLRAGLRKSELLQLRVRDIDLIEKWVVVQVGKGDKGRVVPIRGEVVRALDEFMLTPIDRIKVSEGSGDKKRTRWISRQPDYDDFLLYPAGSKGQTHLWSDPTRPMASTTYQRWWQACVARAGVRYRKGHNARHTYATKLIRESGDIASAQKALGHASVRTTIDEYAHLITDDVARAVEAMERSREKTEA